MCVIDQKTYVHDSGRQEIVEKRHYCHHAVGRTLCRHIETRDLGIVRTVEGRTSMRRNSASAPVVTTSREGRQRRLYPLDSPSKRSSKRLSSGHASVISTASPVDSAASFPSPVSPAYQEVRPDAPMPSPSRKTYPSARQMTPMIWTGSPGPRRTVRADGTASYDRPPPLEMPRAALNERASIPRQSSWPSASANIDEPETLPLRPSSRRVSFQDQRPNISIDVNAATYGYPPAGRPSSTGLSHLPRINTASNNKIKIHPRADSPRNNNNDDQPRREQACLSPGTSHRHRARQSRDAEETAIKRAESLWREREEMSQERKSRTRHDPRAVLDQQQQQQQEDEDFPPSSSISSSATMQRRINAEMAQIAREQRDADRRLREEAARSSPPTPSQRPSTDSPTTPTPLRRPTLLPVAVHNYSPASRDPIAERGAQVIARYARAGGGRNAGELEGGWEEGDAEPRLGDRTSERRERRGRREVYW